LVRPLVEGYSMTETKTRTLVRALSYRITAWAFTIFWTWIFTGDLYKSTGFATALHALLTIDYYLHERVWLKIRWGLYDSH
jgi:uncharacterized membrane protein